jgi:hypothetical protein
VINNTPAFTKLIDLSEAFQGVNPAAKKRKPCRARYSPGLEKNKHCISMFLIL